MLRICRTTAPANVSITPRPAVARRTALQPRSPQPYRQRSLQRRLGLASIRNGNEEGRNQLMSGSMLPIRKWHDKRTHRRSLLADGLARSHSDRSSRCAKSF